MINPQRATALGVAVANVIVKKINLRNKITVITVRSSSFIVATRAALRDFDLSADPNVDRIG